jgi:hypothetical protein
MSDQIVLESLSLEAYQYLLQIQTDGQLSTLSQAVQQVLEEACTVKFLTQSREILTPEQQTLLVDILVEFTQCQAKLANAIVTLNTLTNSILLAHSSPLSLQNELPVAVESRQLKRALSRPTSPQIQKSSRSTDSIRRGLTGTALAERLNTSTSMISRKRSQAGFTLWSQQRDPDGISWVYSSRTRRFHPV